MSYIDVGLKGKFVRPKRELGGPHYKRFWQWPWPDEDEPAEVMGGFVHSERYSGDRPYAVLIVKCRQRIGEVVAEAIEEVLDPLPERPAGGTRCGRCLVLVPPKTFMHDCAGAGVPSAHYVERLEREIERLGECLATNSFEPEGREPAVDAAIRFLSEKIVPAEIPLLEELAAQEHESWIGWTAWMLEQTEKGLIETTNLSTPDVHTIMDTVPCFQRWRRQMGTLYVELSEKEKESDRKEAREKWPLYFKAAQAKRAAPKTV